MDGWVTVGTRLETDDLKKDLKNAQRELEKFSQEEEKLLKKKQKVELDLSDYYEEKKLLEEANNDFLSQARTKEEINNITEIQKQDLAKLNAKYEEQLSALNEINRKINANAQSQGVVRKNIEETSAKLNEMSKNIDIDYNKIGKSMSNLLRKVARWGLAMIGIRSIYAGISRATSTLSQYSDELANKLNSIQLILATAFEPVINFIVDLIYKLLGYLNYIYYKWFGIDLFAQSAAKSMKATNKSAKELKKTLAGFDEVNILNEDGSTGLAGASGKFLAPEQGEIPKWLDFIVKHKNEILAIMGGVGAGLLSWYTGLGLIKSVGIGLAIGGIVYAVENLLDYMKDPSWENFGGVIQGIGVAVLGLGIIFGGLPAIIAGAIIIIWGTFVKYWDKIKEKFQKGIDWLKDKSDWVRNIFGDTIGDVYDSLVDNLQGILNEVDKIMGKIKENFDLTISAVKHMANGEWKEAWDDVKRIFKNAWNTTADLALNFGKMCGNNFVKGWKVTINGAIVAFEALVNLAIDGLNTLIKAANKIPGVKIKDIKQVKFNRLKLATGGIVNNPGRGVPVGNVVTGESGREGVIPLTDPRAMSELGAEIGKWITINNAIDVNMDSRRINRILATSKNNELYNKGGVI